MIVIIEGADGSGKSTLARELADASGATLLHATPPRVHSLIEATSPLAEPGDYVCDRWHFSEMVYGPQHRGGAGLTPNQLLAVDEFLAERGAVVVHCTGRFNTLHGRILARGETMNPVSLRADIEGFTTVLSQTRLPVLLSIAEFPTPVEEILAYARAREASCS